MSTTIIAGGDMCAAGGYVGSVYGLLRTSQRGRTSTTVLGTSARVRVTGFPQGICVLQTTRAPVAKRRSVPFPPRTRKILLGDAKHLGLAKTLA